MDNEMELRFSCSIPDLLADKAKMSEPYRNYNARGNPSSFGIDLVFPELRLSKTLKSSDFHLLRGKIEETMHSWEKKYQNHLDKQHKEKRAKSVDDMNREAKNEIDTLHNILAHTLNIDDAVEWAAIKRRDAFRVKPEDLLENDNQYASVQLTEFIHFNAYGRPTGFEKKDSPIKPTLEEVRSAYGFFSKLFRGNAIKGDFAKRLEEWKNGTKQVNGENSVREAIYKKATSNFNRKRREFEEEKKRDNDALENMKSRYENSDPKAVEDYCDLVLNSSEYPDYFPKNWMLEYREDSRMALVDYSLPAPDQLPTIESYSYVKARDEITEKKLTGAAGKKLYDIVIYQICIRTIHELLEADVIDALDTVAFNGVVTNINPATGIEESKVIMSIVADKDKFNAFDLSRVEPRATFKHLKGVAATTLIDLTPIPPIIKMDKSDKRFISGKDVAAYLDESVNLAAMHWEEFEHLIRELFEKEFISAGGEVKVTQASSDGGVDAIAFDPDPIRGGKIVIQAKRYTNVVGVTAVRDLYGTVMNEGATKGILVTTSDYGKDSYEFAKDKPLTLLNGSNLLALLEKHGHKARINVAEAKKLING